MVVQPASDLEHIEKMSMSSVLDVEQGLQSPKENALNEPARGETTQTIEENEKCLSIDQEKQVACEQVSAGESETVEPNHHSKSSQIEGATTGETEIDTTEQGVDDDMSEGASSEELMDVISFTGEDDGMVKVPFAGECRHDVLPDNVQGHYRLEPNGCAICLCAFEVGDKVSWSSNPSCQHVFHDDCIRDWLMASGRKFLKRQRREQRRSGNLSYDSDPVGKITGFPMLCPCCRQHFIAPEEDESVDEKAAAPATNTAEMNDEEAMIVASS